MYSCVFASIFGRSGRVAKFLHDRRGNIAITFAITIIPVIAMIGAAVDFSNAIRSKHRLQAAVDAAALAVARDGAAMTDEEIVDFANRFFKAHFTAEEIGAIGTLHVVRANGRVQLAVKADVDTSFLPVIGMNRLDVGVNTEVMLENLTAEIALVLDNSGSMSGSKISSLRSAAGALVDTLYGEEDSNPNLKFSLVPFSSAVNVGPQHASASWMDTEAKSSVHSLEFSAPANRFELYDRIANVSWPGCVETRPYPMDVDDTAPDRANGDTLFVPYFAPDEPDIGYYWNSYLADGVGGGNKAVRQKNLAKYTNGVRAGPSDFGATYGIGPAFLCNSQPIMALTGNKDAVQSSIGAMRALGGTNITEGLVWGWRTLSPSEPFTEGLPYGQDTNRKIIILLTDGSNDWSDQGNHNKSYYSPYSYLANGRLGMTSGSKPMIIAKMNERLAEACGNVRRRGIRVYTITFGNLDSATQELMRGCASNPDLYYHAPSTADIQSTFQSIASDITNLRIVR